jgi:transposase
MVLGMSTHVKVELTVEQRAHLEQVIRSGRDLARTQTKARILLLTDRNQDQPRSDVEIAAALHVSKPTIIRTRRRCVLEGVDAALYDKPRPGATPKITGDVEAHLTVLACSTPPDGKGRWTLQMLADKLVELQLVESISDVAVMHRLKKTNSSRGG